ncbi:hypothetical protein UC8_56690 [Roseimaritima ulvae]|uniref:Uncharacterized protein n=1 Tax=Roseimaritima ulvae TaxID=980254 RepID=A0A5B9QX82_9BACT|nr:hypothetical protein UC8_56690 [Roseimaritima ulvae]
MYQRHHPPASHDHEKPTPWTPDNFPPPYS